MLRTHELNVKQDVDSLFHPYTPLARQRETGPLVITRGDGVYVEDDQGRRYLEGMSGLWCTALGFSESRLTEAATWAWRRRCLPTPALRPTTRP